MKLLSNNHTEQFIVQTEIERNDKRSKMHATGTQDLWFCIIY